MGKKISATAVYLIKFGLIALAVVALCFLLGFICIVLNEKMIALKAILSVVTFAFMCVLLFIITKPYGEDAYKLKVNNLRRRKNDEEIEFNKLGGEYSIYKGIVAGLIACLPLILGGVICTATGSGSGVLAFVRVIYSCALSPFEIIFKSKAVWTYVVASIFVILAVEAGYFVGAYKERCAREKILEEKEDLKKL